MSHIKVTPSDKTVEVKFAGETIAKSSRALELKEGSYPAAYYLPLEDVNADAIESTNHQTTCPHKGKASYWTLKAGGQTAENAMWGYLNPKDDVASIKDHVAFYPSKVSIKVGD